MLLRGTGRSAIINMTSYYTDWQTYNLPIFCAGKSMQEHSSRILSLELDGQMDVLTVKGMPVKSATHPNGVDAADLVEGVFKDLG